MGDDLSAAVLEAWETLQLAGHGADALFGERSVGVADLGSEAAHAMGVIEGAGIALGLTALELLGEYGIGWE
jgi:hypothetical protein